MLLFYIFLVAYLLGNSPIVIFPTIIFRFPFLNGILQAYIVCFAVFLIIKNYEQLRTYFSNTRSSVTHAFLDKHNNIKTDLFTFVALSLLISFFVDVTLTKIAQQPLISSLIDLIPESDVIQKYVHVSNNATSNTTNVFDFIKFGSVKTAIFYFPGLPIGTLIVFVLRQLRYKSKKNDINNYPGGTILMLFLLAVPIVLGFDISLIMQGKAPSPDTASSNTESVSVYGLKEFTEFSRSYLINPVYYVTTASTWIFDWYLFSRIWLY